MLNRLKRFFAVLRIKPNVRSDQPITQTVQEDPQVAERIRKIRQIFIDNQTLINARAYRPHSPECTNPVICEKAYCWKFVPDKIVGKPYYVIRNPKTGKTSKITPAKRSYTKVRTDCQK